VQELFQKNSETFKQASQEQLQQMLDPLNKQIKEFKDQTQKQHEKRLEENQTLVNKIQQLTELNQSVQSSAQELTKALRSDSKQQGDYGEMMLQQLFEAADLREGIHYDLQPSYKATQGEGQQQSVRPDCVVYLPKSPAGEERYAVVDSKVALTAYVDYINAEDATTAEQKLKEHTQAIKRHIDQLAQKQYHELPGSALAFTVLFIPNEGALLAALKQHYDLFAQAAQQRIVLVSPSTLMAMLRMIRSLWQQDDINKNAEAIAERAGKLYDKFVNLYETLEDLGKHLERSQASYDKALGQLRDGKGNLTRQVEQLSELGAKHDKRLPESARAALDAATEDDQADEGGRG
jgi:DNA recombination protein RmuC